MPAKAIYHDTVKNGLLKDGWTITHDPYTLSFGQKDVYVDLGAEQFIAAEKQARRIAVEVKSFVSPSDIRDFENALGQYIFYRSLLTRVEPDRKLYLAIPHAVFTTTFNEPITRPAQEDLELAIVTFDAKKEEIVLWTS